MHQYSFFSYQPAHDDELDLAIDQVVDFLGEVEDGWWKGRSKETGKVKRQTEMAQNGVFLR